MVPLTQGKATLASIGVWLLPLALTLAGCRKEREPDLVVTLASLPDEQAAFAFLELRERRGLALWLEATGGQALRPDAPLLRRLLGDAPLARVLGLGTRPGRFEEVHLVNDPSCRPGTPASFGLDICPGDEGPEGLLEYVGKEGYRDPACDLDETDLPRTEREIRGDPCLLRFGTSAGVIGIRKFPNPKFKASEWRGFDGGGEPPFLFGVTCAACHVGFDAKAPPSDPDAAKWHELDLTAGHPFAGAPRRVLGPGPVSSLSLRGSDGASHLASAWDALGICENCAARQALVTRTQDMVAFVEAASARRSLARLAPESLPAKELVAKGRSIYARECASCHDSHKVVSVKEVGTPSCEPVLHAHGEVFPTPGRVRSPSLANVWMSAPFFHNNAVGPTLCLPGRPKDGCKSWSPDVQNQLELFDDAVARLLSPERRGKKMRLLTEPRTLTLADQVLAVARPLDVLLPAGFPAKIVESLDRARLEKALAQELGKAPVEKRGTLWGERRKALAEREALMAYLTPFAACKDLVDDAGHPYGSGLAAADKEALTAFLKTL